MCLCASVFSFFFFKQKTAYEMRISDWSSDVCSSDLRQFPGCDAAAVIADADQADAAFLQVDVDPVRAGVERVLDQFLDHRSRSFDDFAGGDQIGRAHV